MHVQDMIAAHPEAGGQANAALIRCIEACYDCAQACTACADACLAEDMVAELRQCIRLNLDCADLCTAVGSVGSRRTGSNEAVMRALIETCAQACDVCGAECAVHGERHRHCAVCADACRRCEDACRQAADSMTPVVQ